MHLAQAALDLLSQVLYNRYYGTFDDFRAACTDFFNNPQRDRGQLQSLLTENFAMIG
jgi:hypothetical protein